MSRLPIAQIKRLRGLILELVYNGHRMQESRLDDLSLWGLVQDLGYSDVSKNDVVTLLQDLRDRKYLAYLQKRDTRTGLVEIKEIEITPTGRDLVEKSAAEDPAVVLLK